MLALITGGSGSGKSAYAEELAASLHGRETYYVATMICRDEEGRKRVERHRRMRAERHYITIERPLNLKGLVLSAESGGTGNDSGKNQSSRNGGGKADSGKDGSEKTRTERTTAGKSEA